jgi:hypothetical protein
VAALESPNSENSFVGKLATVSVARAYSVEWLMNDEFERIWKEVTYSTYIAGIYLNGLRKTTKFLKQVRWCPDRDSKPAPNTSVQFYH